MTYPTQFDAEACAAVDKWRTGKGTADVNRVVAEAVKLGSKNQNGRVGLAEVTKAMPGVSAAPKTPRKKAAKKAAKKRNKK